MNQSSKWPIEGISSHLPTVNIFSYLGYSFQVNNIVRSLNHKSKDYHELQNSFKGFTVEFEVVRFL